MECKQSSMHPLASLHNSCLKKKKKKRNDNNTEVGFNFVKGKNKPFGWAGSHLDRLDDA